jgi:hypothetical protein
VSAETRFRFRFYDLDLHLGTDSTAAVDRFVRFYRRFLSDPSGAAPGARRVELSVHTRMPNPWNRPAVLRNGVVLDGHTTAVPRDPDALADYVYLKILNTVQTAVRSHVLIHAGAVARRGRGVIVGADSWHGKTTMVIEAVRRGADFLSDEIAAIGRADGRVHAYPRALGVRPDALARLGLDVEGRVLDIEAFRPGCLAESAEIGHIVVLRDAESPSAALARADPPLTVFVDRVDDDLVAVVRSLAGGADVQVTRRDDLSWLRVAVGQKRRLLAAIEAACEDRGITVLGFLPTTEERHPLIAARARLVPARSSDTAMSLVRLFRGGHRSELLKEDLGGSPRRLFLELAAVAASARCHELFLGPREEMADLLWGLIDG